MEQMMVNVIFVSANGEDRIEARAEDGANLLQVAQNCNLPLEGTCEGQMACSTCHVIVNQDWFAKLPPATEMEEDMLDLATGACRTSRLACQIILDKSLNGLIVHIPPESRNMQGL